LLLKPWKGEEDRTRLPLRMTAAKNGRDQGGGGKTKKTSWQSQKKKKRAKVFFAKGRRTIRGTREHTSDKTRKGGGSGLVETVGGKKKPLGRLHFGVKEKQRTVVPKEKNCVCIPVGGANESSDSRRYGGGGNGREKGGTGDVTKKWAPVGDWNKMRTTGDLTSAWQGD